MAASTLEKIKPIAPVSSSASPLDRPHLITVDRFFQMIGTGVYQEDDPIYLWKGRLVEKMTKYQPHSTAISVLTRQLIRIIPDGWHLRPEQPIVLDDYSMPEPDLLIVRGMERDFLMNIPRARDVSLLIEVADSSLGEDQGDKLRTYAEHKIAIYWVVNIPDRRIEEYTKPWGKGDKARFREVRVFQAEENVSVVLDGREMGAIKVSDIILI